MKSPLAYDMHNYASAAPVTTAKTTLKSAPLQDLFTEKYSLRHRQKRKAKSDEMLTVLIDHNGDRMTKGRGKATASEANKIPRHTMMRLKTTTPTTTAAPSSASASASASASPSTSPPPPSSTKAKTKAAPLSKYRRKTANARERTRMREINSAFEHLRQCVPPTITGDPNEAGSNEKLTKITTLRLAMKYISILTDALENPNFELNFMLEQKQNAGGEWESMNDVSQWSSNVSVSSNDIGISNESPTFELSANFKKTKSSSNSGGGSNQQQQQSAARSKTTLTKRSMKKSKAKSKTKSSRRSKAPNKAGTTAAIDRSSKSTSTAYRVLSTDSSESITSSISMAGGYSPSETDAAMTAISDILSPMARGTSTAAFNSYSSASSSDDMISSDVASPCDHLLMGGGNAALYFEHCGNAVPMRAITAAGIPHHLSPTIAELNTLLLESDGESMHLSDHCPISPHQRVTAPAPASSASSSIATSHISDYDVHGDSMTTMSTLENPLELSLRLLESSSGDSMEEYGVDQPGPPPSCLSPLITLDTFNPFADLLHTDFSEQNTLDLFLT